MIGYVSGGRTGVFELGLQIVKIPFWEKTRAMLHLSHIAYY